MTGLHLRRTDDNADAIAALHDATGGPVPAGGLLSDLNRKGRRAWAPGRAVHRAWTFDRADRRDLRWWPQGVSTSSDADVPDVVGGGRRLVAVTWYAKKLPGDAQKHGARVTFLDLDTARYRHVLLVEPTLEDGEPGLKPLPVHAGGLVWAGTHLHVAATGKGFHTVDLADLVRLPDTGPWRRHGLGYRYVLPVRASYRAGADEGVERLRYSFLSLDRASSHLLVGEYASDRSGATRRLARFPLDPGTLLPVLDADGGAAPVLLGDGVGHMQGVAAAGGRLHVTTSHGRSRLGSVWTGSPGDLHRHRWATPMGPEDLAYDAGTDELWSVSEHPWARWVFSMKRSWFDER